MPRQPAVSGQFYPAEARSLLDEIRRHAPPGGTPSAARAVVVPHAGYIYSGSVAGAVYAAVELPRRFIILGPNHTGRGATLALHPAGGWRTPLGVAPIDEDLNARLLAECPRLELDAAAHRQEHALEVQIPFLQALAGDVSFAAICVGTSHYAALEELGHALARVVESSKEPVLVVSSSDMNHYEPAEVSEPKDRLAIERVLEVDAAGLHRVVLEKDISMCGFAPTTAVLTACRDLGASRGRLIRYAHSGEVNGDLDRVVGYAGIVIA